MPVWLSEDEYRVLGAACERLIPEDDTAGAGDAGVPDYIDGLLGAFSVDPPRIWAGGPTSGRLGGAAGFRLLPPAGAARRAGVAHADRGLARPPRAGVQRARRRAPGAVPGRAGGPRRRLLRRRAATSRTSACAPARRSRPCSTSTAARACTAPPSTGATAARWRGRPSGTSVTSSPGATPMPRWPARDRRRRDRGIGTRGRDGGRRPHPGGLERGHRREGPQPPHRPRRTRAGWPATTPTTRSSSTSAISWGPTRSSSRAPSAPAPRTATVATSARSTPSRRRSGAGAPTPTARCHAFARRTSPCSPRTARSKAPTSPTGRLATTSSSRTTPRPSARWGWPARPGPTPSPPGARAPIPCRAGHRCTAPCSRRRPPSAAACIPTPRPRRPTPSPTTAGRPATTAGSARSSVAPSTPRATRWPCCSARWCRAAPSCVSESFVSRVRTAGGRATGVDVVGPDGAERTIGARHVVIAGGAIETPRLMLLSGFEHPLIGRYLMVHFQTFVVGALRQRVHGHRGRAVTHLHDDAVIVDDAARAAARDAGLPWIRGGWWSTVARTCRSWRPSSTRGARPTSGSCGRRPCATGCGGSPCRARTSPRPPTGWTSTPPSATPGGSPWRGSPTGRTSTSWWRPPTTRPAWSACSRTSGPPGP